MTPTRLGTISVVMPNRNHGRYIEGALEAICSQSRPPDRVVVVDDQSTDDSRDVIRRVAERRPVIEVVHHERALGTVATLNERLALIDTEYVLCAAADDLILPGYFERTAAGLDAHSEAAFATTSSGQMDENGAPLPNVFQPASTPDHSLTPADTLRLLTRYGTFAWGNTTLYRTNILRRIGGFPPELGAFADGYLMQSLALRHGCVYIPEILGVWRRNVGGNAGRMNRSAGALEKVRDIVLERMRGVDSDVFPERYVDVFERRWRYSSTMSLMETGADDEDCARVAGLGRVETAVMRLLRRLGGTRWVARWLLIRLLPGDARVIGARKLGLDH